MWHNAHRFTDDNLRRTYNHELADIISMVKHAASGAPLLSAEERVDRALIQVRAGKTFTPQQERWLALIRNHLIENLAIDHEDFHLLTFTRAGATWGRVNRDSEGTLASAGRDQRGDGDLTTADRRRSSAVPLAFILIF